MLYYIIQYEMRPFCHRLVSAQCFLVPRSKEIKTVKSVGYLSLLLCNCSLLIFFHFLFHRTECTKKLWNVFQQFCYSNVKHCSWIYGVIHPCLILWAIHIWDVLLFFQIESDFFFKSLYVVVIHLGWWPGTYACIMQFRESQ
jgi:hypothetical protein